jgi:hypothetical protein
VADYRPIVAVILQSESRDFAHIERTLDGLLDFCFDAEALTLYKQLCRHYLSIDPAATAEYVHAFRRMWDPEDKDRVSRIPFEATEADNTGRGLTPK